VSKRKTQLGPQSGNISSGHTGAVFPIRKLSGVRFSHSSACNTTALVTECLVGIPRIVDTLIRIEVVPSKTLLICPANATQINRFAKRSASSAECNTFMSNPRSTRFILKDLTPLHYRKSSTVMQRARSKKRAEAKSDWPTPPSTANSLATVIGAVAANSRLIVPRGLVLSWC
jgi:hypothetical protein